MNILDFLNRLLFQDCTKKRAKPAPKSLSSKEAADQALKVFFSKNRINPGR